MRNEAEPLVSIIAVNYNQPQVTYEFLDSLRHITYPNYEVIVVDNGSPDGPPERIPTDYPEVKLVISEKNLGFAGGNNLGVANSKGDYLMFLNNDTEVDPGFLQPLLQIFKEHPDAGMASLKLIYFHSENKKIIQYAGSTGINTRTGRGAKIGHLKLDDGTYDDIRETQLGHGAAMMIPREVVRKVSMMPDIFFLYYEEHDWCEMIKRAGYKIYYVGTSKVYHKESMTVGKNSPLKMYYMTRGRLLFMRRNSSFFHKHMSMAFFTFLSIPKNTIRLAFRREFKLLKAFWEGYLWHLTHHWIYDSPQLIDEKGESLIKNTARYTSTKYLK